MDTSFGRVRSIIGRLLDVLKCQKCLELKEENSMLFYHSCDHFYCIDCLVDKTCPLCKNPLDKPINIVNDKNMLSLYQSLVNFELPSQEEIKVIYENFVKSKEEKVKDQENNLKHFDKKDLSNTCDEPTGKTIKKNERPTIKKFTEESTPHGYSLKKKQIKKPSPLEEKNITPPASSSRSNKRSKTTPISTSCTRSRRGRKAMLDVTVTPVQAVKTSTPTLTTPANAKFSPSASKININKRNPKGETQLHLACKKSNINMMKELLQAGANPNAKDNAGWTPLHDSVFSGNIDVIKFLLDNGAKVNIPGLENTTALHEAIAKGSVKVVKLLLDYGADINAMNIFRETPLDLVTKYNLTELKEILLNSSNNSKAVVSEAIDSEDSVQTISVYKHNLCIEHEKMVNKFAEKFYVCSIQTISSKTPPTHIIVANDNFEITWALISSVCDGCYIISVNWIKDSIEANTLKPAIPYEVKTDKTAGFARGRANKQNQLPGLFSGCHFFFGGNFERYEFKNLTVGKEDLKMLIEKNGGLLLKRCPDPESLALEKTIPFHANVVGSLRETSYFIIYQTQKWDPKPKYNMSHMKTLPADWLLACIYKFELIDPKEYKGCEYF